MIFDEGQAVSVDGCEEARPAATGIILGRRAEQELVATDAIVLPCSFLVPIHPREVSLRPSISGDMVLL